MVDDTQKPEADRYAHVIEHSAYQNALDLLHKTEDKAMAYKQQLEAAQYELETKSRQADLYFDDLQAERAKVKELESRVKRAEDYVVTCASHVESIRLVEERDQLKSQNAEMAKEIERQNELLANKLGEVGQDVSCCYDFKDLIRRLDGLVHEAELEKAQARIVELEQEVKRSFARGVSAGIDGTYAHDGDLPCEALGSGGK